MRAIVRGDDTFSKLVDILILIEEPWVIGGRILSIKFPQKSYQSFIRAFDKLHLSSSETTYIN